MQAWQLNAALVLTLAGVACDCEPRPLPPSLNTVDPATHDPYQRRQPLTTGNPMSATDSKPDQIKTPDPKEAP